MKKLHRIGNSKEPTSQQMLKMVENLRSKLKEYAVIKTSAWAHSTNSITRMEYRISTNSSKSFRSKSWPEVIAQYRKLMKG